MIALGVVCAISACNPSTPDACREFFSLPIDTGEQVFATYQLEKQLVVYRCGLNLRPPASYLSSLIAERGEEAIPVLIARLKTEKDEFFQYGLIDVFWAMSLRGRLRNKPEVVAQIAIAVDRMKINAVKERASELLREIETNSNESLK